MFYRIFSLTIGLVIFAAGGFAQSGRVKPAEKTATERPQTVFYPKEPVVERTKESKTNKSSDSEDDDVIKVESALVPIPVSVIDANGRSVGNLRLEDFELLIDNQPAEISEISRSQLPVRLALLFDNSSSVAEAREFEKKAAVRFFKQVIRPEKDLAALFSVASASKLEQPLTRNVSQIVRAIESFPIPEGATALLDGVIQAADYLRDAQGRRVIVIVSDGEDTLSDSTFDQTVRAAQSANCQIYVVKTTDFENFKKTGERGGNANIRTLTAERRMQDLALQTGGTVYSPIDEDELNKAFNRISAELAEQYILNYYPSEETSTAKFRAISLRLKNKENLTVRARKGYYVSKK